MDALKRKTGPVMNGATYQIQMSVQPRRCLPLRARFENGHLATSRRLKMNSTKKPSTTVKRQAPVLWKNYTPN